MAFRLPIEHCASENRCSCWSASTSGDEVFRQFVFRNLLKRTPLSSFSVGEVLEAHVHAVHHVPRLAQQLSRILACLLI